MLKFTEVSSSRKWYVEHVAVLGDEPLGTLRERDGEYTFRPVPGAVLTEKDLAGIAAIIQSERERERSKWTKRTR